MHLPLLRPLAIGSLLLASTSARAQLSREEMVKLLTLIDDRQRNGGDYKSLAYVETKERGKTDVVREALVFRRDADDKMMILFTKPKGEAGKGYLRMDRNLWFYDPNVGRWERRTERERIAGTDSRRADFDESRLAEEFDPTYVGSEKLGAFQVHRLKLAAKEGVDVAYPVVELWIDQSNSNILKRQEFALSGRLMRTAYFPSWEKLYSESKKAEVWYPKKMIFLDEVEKENQTMVLIKQVDLRPLEANLFTKAWVESKSR